MSIGVDSSAVVGAFGRGRAKNRDAHALLVRLFELQVEYEFLLSLKWIPTADNAVADAISRPSRESTIRLAAAAFRTLWGTLSPFSVDLMARAASAQRSPASGRVLPLLSQYDCPGSAGSDALTQDVSRVPGTDTLAFGFCFPPPIMAGHVVQHLDECRAHAVVVLPDIKAYRFCGSRWPQYGSVELPVWGNRVFLSGPALMVPSGIGDTLAGVCWRLR